MNDHDHDDPQCAPLFVSRDLGKLCFHAVLKIKSEDRSVRVPFYFFPIHQERIPTLTLTDPEANESRYPQSARTASWTSAITHLVSDTILTVTYLEAHPQSARTAR